MGRIEVLSWMFILCLDVFVASMSRSLSSINTIKLSNLSLNETNTNTQVDVQVIVTENAENDIEKLEYQRPAYVAVGLIMAMTATSILFPLIVTSRVFGLEASMWHKTVEPCTDPCSISLVESIPENLTYPEGSPTYPSTYETWRTLIRTANKTIDIASFYWTLKGTVNCSDPSDWQGEQIFKDLLMAGTKRGIKIRIAQNAPNMETAELIQAEAAEVRTVNFTRLMGSGVLHTKFWVIDKKHFYMGSANMDWRSLTQVKEMGAAVYNCSCLAQDMNKVFEVYWYLGLPNNTVPYSWPAKLKTSFNEFTPMQLKLNRTKAFTYISSSPSSFCPMGRTIDLEAILDIISRAKKFIYIAVMDYFPVTLYTKPLQFWPIIDNALRRAAIERNVDVRLLASFWIHSRPDIINYLRSLAELNGAHNASVQARLFHVPVYTPAQRSIPFARVNHNKYMVTDNTAYIGTSNWSGDYFISTGGIGLVINQTDSIRPGVKRQTVQEELKNVFLRDWNSAYSKPVLKSKRPSASDIAEKMLKKYSGNEL